MPASAKKAKTGQHRAIAQVHTAYDTLGYKVEGFFPTGMVNYKPIFTKTSTVSVSVNSNFKGLMVI